MSVFSASEIADLRSEIQMMFDHTLDVYRGTAATSDPYGGYDEGEPVLTHSGIPCEIYPGMTHIVDMLDQGQLVSTQLYTVTVAVGTDIRKNDIVVITSWNDLKLRVNAVFEPESLELEMRFVGDKEVLSG